MLVRVTLVWRPWQWDATKKTQWESVQACLWFPYKFFSPNPVGNTLQSEQLELEIARAKFHCRLLPGQEIPSGVSWRLPRWIVLKGQKWPYAFRKQNGPHWVLSRFPRILVAYGSKKETSAPLSTGSKFMSDFITDFPRADKNWQCWKLCFFFSNNPPNTLQYFLRKQ